MWNFTLSILKFKSSLLVKIRLVEGGFCHGNHEFNFTCTSFIICYHATQIFGILNILQFFLIR